MADISVRSVTKVYPNGHEAVRDVDLDVADGEFLVLVGPSGCGKSTLLRLIAGLEEVTGGEIHLGGRDVTKAPPGSRDLAMVFQSYALYPHLSVRRNIGYPLKVAKVARDEIDRRVAETARLLELEAVLDRRPAQLSGGQRQRVAMGRAIVREPKAFLMDEPLSNLDAQLRVQMRAEIARLQLRLGTTTVYVTHDQVEAMTMGSRVAVLSDGRIQQVDTPQRLYERPANRFVATFIGSPRMNLFAGRWVVDGDGMAVALGGQRLPLTGFDAAGVGRRGREVTVGIRPESLTDATAGPEHTLDGEVELIEALGSELHVHLRLTGTGEPFIARFPPRSAVQVGDNLKVAVDVDGLHLFDPQSGGSLR